MFFLHLYICIAGFRKGKDLQWKWDRKAYWIWWGRFTNTTRRF